MTEPDISKRNYLGEIIRCRLLQIIGIRTEINGNRLSGYLNPLVQLFPAQFRRFADNLRDILFLSIVKLTGHRRPVSVCFNVRAQQHFLAVLAVIYLQHNKRTRVLHTETKSLIIRLYYEIEIDCVLRFGGSRFAYADPGCIG